MVECRGGNVEERGKGIFYNDGIDYCYRFTSQVICEEFARSGEFLPVTAISFKKI